MSGKEISDTAKKTYHERLKFLRKGQESFQAKEISKAVQFYATYLKALANYFGVTEERLDPKLFDLSKDKAELLLISQVYWDLSKAYDRSPGLQNECVRCLNQFVKFTVGFKHQHINAQLLKKYLRQNKVLNQQPFKNTLDRIQIDSKSCFIATYAYGEVHPTTEKLRVFKKNVLANSSPGRKFISLYYSLSPYCISFCKKNIILGSIFKTILFKPLIKLFLFLLVSWRKDC